MTANNLSHYRALAKLSQSDLAKKSELSQAYVSLLEQGERGDISIDRARALVRAINESGVTCTLDDVFPWGAADRAA
jgi:putative transcriptional regulator